MKLSLAPLDEPSVLATLSRRRRIANLYQHARIAVEFARIYRREGDTPTSRRVRDSLGSVKAYRLRIAQLRGAAS